MTKNQLRERYAVIVLFHAIIISSYWYMASPPNPWILAVAAAGILASIGITRYKYRAGHFDQQS
jgi:hypothetical protein